MGDENIFRVPEKKSRRHSVIGLLPDFSGLRKRKRKSEDDTLSLQSFESDTKKKSRRKSLLRVSSIANLLSPKSSRKAENFQRTLSFKIPQSQQHISRNNVSPYKAPPPSPGKQRLCRTWSDMMTEDGSLLSLSNQDIKLQEAIYELYKGEQDLIDDLKVVKNTYRDSMQKLCLMTEGELEQIFGHVDDLVPIHEDLVSRLQVQRLPDGTTQQVGKQLVEWVPSLKAYIPFCANQVFGKILLDEKKNDPAVDDFLQRCQESPFSRKLDLWALLDGVRGKFMKYPLLLKSIQKYNTNDLLDCKDLSEAIKLAEKIVAEADTSTGEAKCIFYRSRITYLYDDQKHPEIDNSKALLCSGILKNNKGSKLQLLLFDKVLVVTRPVSQVGQQYYQVYRDPIPVSDLVVEDLKDGEVRMGSFRSAFGSSQTSKNLLKVSFRDSNKGQSHTLMSNDQHDKRQWLHWLEEAIEHESNKEIKPGD